jgi:predicted enzyme related to lactoylglutathione lyase
VATNKCCSATSSGPARTAAELRAPRAVSEPATGKVRIHLDVTVDDIEKTMAAVIKLGGRATGERHDHDDGVVVVMADPERHEFCLVQYYE